MRIKSGVFPPARLIVLVWPSCLFSVRVSELLDLIIGYSRPEAGIRPGLSASPSQAHTDTAERLQTA